MLSSSTSSSVGRPASIETRFRKTIVDPWRNKFDQLKQLADNELMEYRIDDYVIQTVKYYFPIVLGLGKILILRHAQSYTSYFRLLQNQLKDHHPQSMNGSSI